jgi:hypothetical protein
VLIRARWWMGAATLAVLAASQPASTQAPAAPSISVSLGADGRLRYSADARGNTIVDFSHAGYGGGGVAIPDIPARIIVGPDGGQHRERIQAALDLVSRMPADSDGFRGAVFLQPGKYEIDTALRIGTSGVVLRGSGDGENGTVMVAAGTSRRALIDVTGYGERQEVAGSRRAVADAYVPVGSRTLTLDNVSGFTVGDAIVVHRPSTKSWISLLGMDTFPGWRPENRLHWQPASRDVRWDRVITAIDGNRLTIDAPLTTALESAHGGGSVYKYTHPGRIRHVGIEGLRAVSAYDESRPFDEDHAWVAISLDKVENAWVRHVTALHFVSSVVDTHGDTKWLTIEDVQSIDPVSEIGGYRRRAFSIGGELTLVQRSHSRGAQHDYVTSFTAAGPNAFLDSTSEESLDFSGPLDSWASGVLYDNVRIRGNALRLVNRDVDDQGAGWAAANSVLWNCEATDVEAQNPPGAYNRAFGCKGITRGDGIVEDTRVMPYRDFFRGASVQPRSLYLAQLAERRGNAATELIAKRAIQRDAGTARPLTDADVRAATTRHARDRLTHSGQRLRVKDGRFEIGGRPAWTKRTTYSWFQAQMPPSLAPAFGSAITRFAPGRTGPGLTDDLDAMVESLPPGAAFYHHYGLWYDRRRVNHNYDGSAERRTGDVWAPFMELPWARSGTGKAWDGLSKYDLTRFNPWYFDRVKTFADLCDRKGRILYYNFYFQHWLLESRAHYVDFPWRPVNTIQVTDLPDEVPAANTFYDISHPLRRDLHRRYIRHVLDVLGSNTNVVFGIDREYTGSLEFLQFWLDEIARWQIEHGRKVHVALEVPKAQLDAVLGDPARRPLITAMDVHGWVYRHDGALFAIRGGVNRAPREQRADIATAAELDALKQRLGAAAVDSTDFLNGPEYQRLFDELWRSTRPMRYRTWHEYRDQFPELVMLQQEDEYVNLALPKDGRE